MTKCVKVGERVRRSTLKNWLRDEAVLQRLENKKAVKTLAVVSVLVPRRQLAVAGELVPVHLVEPATFEPSKRGSWERVA